MTTIKCRDCDNQVSIDAMTCPSCGAPRPSVAQCSRAGIDWKTGATFNNIPLIHIAFGKDKAGKRRVATGIIAIGQFAKGYLVIAQFGIGFAGIAQFGVFGVGITQFGIAAALITQFGIMLWGLMQIGVAIIHGSGQIVYP